MTPEEIAAKEKGEAAAAAAKEKADAEAKAEADAELEQDPLEKELEKIQKKGEGKTELEKAIHRKKILDQRIAELKGDSGEEDLPEEEDDAAPVTVGMLKKLEKEKAQKTALSLAEEQIQDNHELELVRHHLSSTIKPSGNPAEDLKNARAIVNSVKNSQIAEELARKGAPKRNGSGSGAPGRQESAFEPTPEEAAYMGHPFNLKKEDILAARKAGQS